MYSGIRPEILRICEETVVNLKELESRIDVLKGTLSVLCQNVGHPAAAQLALSPSRGALTSFGAPQGMIGVPQAFSPLSAQVPFGQGLPPTTIPQQPPWGQATPWSTPTFGQAPFSGVNPFAQPTPFPQVPGIASPYGSPFSSPASLGTPYATPFGVAQGPYAHLQNPYLYR